MFGDDFFGPSMFGHDYFGAGGASPPSPGGSGWTFFVVTPLEIVDYRTIANTIPG